MRYQQLSKEVIDDLVKKFVELHAKRPHVPNKGINSLSTKGYIAHKTKK